MNKTRTFALVVLSLLSLLTVIPNCGAQEPSTATVNTSIGGDGTGTIVVEAHGQLPKPPVFFTAAANATAQIGAEFIDQTIDLTLKVVQGDATTLSLGLAGQDLVTEVVGEQLKSWSVRQEGATRFLDLNVNPKTTELKVQVKVRSRRLDLKNPETIELTHLTPGSAVGFSFHVGLQYAPGVEGTVIQADGFAPVSDAITATTGKPSRFQSTTGGILKLSVNRSGATPAAVELTETSLAGTVHANGNSVSFQYRGKAIVTVDNAEITILSGAAAPGSLPADANYRLRLVIENGVAVYKLTFPKAGEFPLSLDFVATLGQPAANSRILDFTVATSAVVPLTLNGLAADLEFQRDQESIVPLKNNDVWLGFLPATGRAKLQWKAARQAGEGKLFFSTTGRIESQLGAGLLRQDHLIEYQVLQGELRSMQILLQGPGEILEVQGGTTVVGWNVTTQGDNRLLEITLSQPVTGMNQIKVRSQTPLGAFPVTVQGLRLNPVGSIRHSGHLRLSNIGSVRLQPTELKGLSQLAPEQFPGDAIQARQSFVYRFPAVDYSFSVTADSIEPEVSVSEVVVYELTETDRIITADIELDVREAAIREWNFSIPPDYSVVSVTGASVADYVTATAVENNSRNLKVVFSQDVLGRHLVSLRLEKSEAATAGAWALNRVEYPGVKSVRGDIGIVSAPGFRITAGQVNLLVEKPLSFFPKPSPHLQQAFRIREPNWSATMQVELLDRSVQSDVFHLYSLNQETVYGSALINYFVTGAPVSEWRVTVPESMGNVMVEGQNVRTWRREADTLIVTLHQPVMGAYTLLVTFEEKPDKTTGTFQAGRVSPTGVQGERGYVQVVSPMQVEIEPVNVSENLLTLDPLELPAEFRLLSTAPPLGTWQYTSRPFDLNLKVSWFEPGTTVDQVVEFSEANSRVSADGELVTDVLYYVKTRGQRTMKIHLPAEPVRLWAVTVNGAPVTARQADDATLIPLPGGVDPNSPVEVRLRLGKPAVEKTRPELMLPLIDAPVLKTQWSISGDEKHVLLPAGGTVSPPVPVQRPSGFAWIARRGLLLLCGICFFAGLGTQLMNKSIGWQLSGCALVVVAMVFTFMAGQFAYSEMAPPEPLKLNLPVASAGESVQIRVSNVPLWRVNLSWIGLGVLLAGLVTTVVSFRSTAIKGHLLFRCGGILMIAAGILLHGDSAVWFFSAVGVALLLVLIRLFSMIQWPKQVASPTPVEPAPESASGAASITTTLAFFAMVLSSANVDATLIPDGHEPSDSIIQQWQITHQEARLKATGTITLTGKSGDQFLLLKAPAVLTKFEGAGLRVTRRDVPGVGLCYVVHVGSPDNANAGDAAASAAKTYTATFEYQLEGVRPTEGLAVLTGAAAVQEVTVSYDEAGWEVAGPTAIRIEQLEAAGDVTQAKVLLGPGPASLVLKPRTRDVTMEKTQFFVEASNLYLPGPGVVDGRHRLNIRPSQGQVTALNVVVPKGLTVTTVAGPVTSWQFDADSGGLTLAIEPAQAQPFDVMIETQRGLDPLPADVVLSPLRVTGANGEVGLVAVAFGPEARPEKVEPKIMTIVNPGDFDAGLINNPQATLHCVYRYGTDGGELAVRVAPVASEVRVTSKEVVSLGEERVVLASNFAVEISRAGLFELSFPLPAGLEVESLTGDALHHWAERSENGVRHIVLHLNGRTLGTQTFALTLTGAAPTDVAQWQIPRFELNEAARQTGELVVRPATGLRLRTVTRQNVSETDPRALGGEGQGALAFRLLQKDWNLVLGVEKLDPWVTGQVLHQMTVREGQTRSAVAASFNVQNASIASMQVSLPITNADEIRTVRAIGNAVSDIVRTAPDSNLWEIQFKRRVVGKLQFQIEFERRGDRLNDEESLSPLGFPDARQISYFFAIRAGGRLELETGELTQGWQRVDWSTVPQSLREADNRTAPALALRAVDPPAALTVRARRHSLADGLKLRVAEGSLTTVLSSTGDQLTAVDVVMEVIQRSSLIVSLPKGGELFSIFVNGESVNSIRQTTAENTWQFHILPGIDDRTAKVRFVYSVPGEGLNGLQLRSPQLNVPLENISWNVIAPKGFQLNDNDGNLELVRQTTQKDYDRDSYLSAARGQRQVQAEQATQLLEQANLLLQAGEQSKARWALNSVANQYALDAASNEDARIQLENLQTQQAIVGLNTRRQRLYLDNSDDSIPVDNKQLREAAAENPVLQQDQLNFRPQELSQLLRGNTTEDNAVLQRIAARLVQHQHTTDPAPQAIIISLPEEGDIYTFGRTVQVAENAPLELELDFQSRLALPLWQIGAVSGLLILLCLALVSTKRSVAQV
ncbi:MAG: hypothetical protein JNM43_21540 [Planctomycetaceae bacterium]|nr:hypothetical protein [Planctomycetaceae bacterium]